MIVRFCLYSILKNLRFADAFLLLFLLDLRMSYTGIGALLGFGALVTALLEIPSGVLADRWGRVSSVAACFIFYAVAFTLFPSAAHYEGTVRFVWLYAAVTAFGLGEALRTGGHKAIMLDWLESTGRLRRVTAVIGLTRAFSKYTTGISALAGGVMLFTTRDYQWLFYGSAAAAAGGFVLMLTYPREFEGEQRREAERAPAEPSNRPSLWRRLTVLAAAPGVVYLFLQSVIFESQSQLMLKYYLQPFLKEGLEASGIMIVGAGALWVGTYEFLRNGLGGFGAMASSRLERRMGGREDALRRAYVLGFLISIAIAVCVWQRWVIPGLLVLVVLTILQNARRPVFVSAFNEVMDKPQRATSLSIESQARSLLAAILLPITGWAADQFGLMAAFAMTAGVLGVGLLIVRSEKR